MKRLKFKSAVRLWVNGLLQKVPWTKYWLIKSSFVWYIDYYYKEHKYIFEKGDQEFILNKIIVPVWFKSDFWSIPRIFWLFFDKTKYVWFLLHDYLYWNKLYNRLVSDEILYKALLVEWASKIEATAIYIGVRIGWWLAYNKKIWIK